MSQASEPNATCGAGLAEASALPDKLAGLIGGLAEVLEGHRRALDLKDENARHEDVAYRELAEQHRSLAETLRKTAERMAGYRSLPMGRHHSKEMASPSVREAFSKFVELEQELLSLLQQRLERDRALLSQMAGATR
jgi:hypothetical protein